MRQRLQREQRPATQASPCTQGPMLRRWEDADGSLPTAGWVLVLACAFRVANAVLVRTYFSPDEYWQSLEVAHEFVFGTHFGSTLTWEWLPPAQIRGSLHPIVFAALYASLRALGLDSQAAVAHGPRVLQGIAAGVADYFTYAFCWRHSKIGERHQLSFVALVCQLSSWFLAFCGVRTLSDSMAWPFCCAGLALWPPRPFRRSWQRPAAIICFAVAVALRPPVAPAFAVYGIWQTMRLAVEEEEEEEEQGGEQMKDQRGVSATASFLLREVLPIAGAALLACTLLDRAFYGEWVNVWLNFARFNLLGAESGIGSEFYGSHPWHWYLTQGLPVFLGLHLPLTAVGAVSLLRPDAPGSGKIGTKRRWLDPLLGPAVLALGAVVSLSLSPHKEFRFLLPCVAPAATLLTGRGFVAVVAARGWWKWSPRAMEEGRRGGSRVQPALAVAALVLVLSGALPAYYFSRWHQAGPIAAVEALARTATDRASSSLRDGSVHGASAASGSDAFVVDVDFLMPCHSAPLYSHVHVGAPVRLSTLDCSPPLTSEAAAQSGAYDVKESASASAIARKATESGRFEADPCSFAKKRYGGGSSFSASSPPSRTLPTHIVAFDWHLEQQCSPQLTSLGQYLAAIGFREKQRFFHAHFSGDADAQGVLREVVILEPSV